MTCRKKLHNFLSYNLDSKKLFLFLIIIGFFGAFLLFFNVFTKNNTLNAATSPDAIAIRVIPNPENISPLRWYREQNFSGSPQLLYVDGYEAVRDGRTIYVNAANIKLSDSLYYTNIYLISYNQDAENETVDIFGRILKNWKFNTNLPIAGSGPFYCFNKKSDCKGTVGCWTFDGDFTDSSGNNLDGTPQGNVGFTMGNNGIAGDFDGTGDYVDLGNPSSLNFTTGNFTIEALINPSAFNSGSLPRPYGGIVVYGNAGGGATFRLYHLEEVISGEAILWGQIRNDTTPNPVSNIETPAFTINLNTEYHVIFVVDTDFIRLYVNGSEVGNGTARIINLQPPDPSFTAKIGYDSGGEFEGEIDEVKIYNRALSADEIARKYSSILSKCLTDSDCKQGEFCNSFKSRIARDTSRLADMADIRSAVEQYRDNNGSYPRLESGTYLPSRTISNWPSWNNMFGQEVNATLPVDPINKLGPCYDPNPLINYSADTCWDEANKSFNDPTPGNDLFNLPDFSYAYIYTASSTGEGYNICANMETGTAFAGVANYNCNGNVLFNNPPVFRNINMPAGVTLEEYTGYIEAYDPDGDILEWTINISPGNPWTNWAVAPILRNTAILNQKQIYSEQAGDTNAGGYNFSVTIDDHRGGISTCEVAEGCNIIITDAPTCVDTDYDGYGTSTPTFFGKINGCVYDEADCNDLDGTINPGAEEICGDSIDQDCDLQDLDCNAGCGDGFCDVLGGECSNDSCAGDCSLLDCCGNGIADGLVGEECDDGDSINNDECANSCVLTYCGDGEMQVPNGHFVSEQCDDGNLEDGDGCSGSEIVGNPSNCQIENIGCVPDGCNANCPFGCLPADDSDCGCLDDGLGVYDESTNPEACCGIMCSSLEDPNCSASCGNELCEDTLGENCDNCSLDCGICWTPCGNGLCEINLEEPENQYTCPGDCLTSCTGASDSLVSWWGAIASTTVDVADLKETNPGEWQNCLLPIEDNCYSAGIVGEAFQFNNVDTYIEVPYDSSLDITDALTIEGWIYLNSVGDDNIILIKDGGANNIWNHPYMLSIINDGGFNRLYFSIANGTDNISITSLLTFEYNVLPSDNIWYYVAAVYDGTSLRLYINSIFDSFVPVGPSFSIIHNSEDLRIGAQYYTGAPRNIFSGKIDELSIYNEALGASEIKNIYNASSIGKCKVMCEFPFEFPCILF